jgi:hypothetical protein
LEVAVQRVDHDEPDIVYFHLSDQKMRDLAQAELGGVEVLHADAPRLDRSGNVVMLMVAYGPVQNYRLKAHRPEACYTAAGFRIFGKHGEELAYHKGQQPLKLTRLVGRWVSISDKNWSVPSQLALL